MLHCKMSVWKNLIDSKKFIRASQLIKKSLCGERYDEIQVFW